MYSPIQILSNNKKCGRSLNLPISGHCRPTKACAFCCYARSGNTVRPGALKKASYVSKYLVGKDLGRLVDECSQLQHVRLNGTGDLLPEHVRSVLYIARRCSDTKFWGMTRKVEIAEALNGRLSNLNMLVTVDATSPASVWDYEGRMCYGTRRPGDVVPSDGRLVTVFPRHARGRVVNGVKHHPKDCLAVWHKISGCNVCGRCWSWKGAK